MEKINTLILQKSRSIPAVIRDGYRLYTGNFKRLFRASWIAAIVYGLCFALMMNFMINDVLSLVVTVSTFGWQTLDSLDFRPVLLMAGGSVLLFVMAALTLASYATGACTVHQKTGEIERPARWFGTFNLKALLRLLMATVWMTLLMAVVCALFAAVIYGVMEAGIVDNLWKSVATIALLLILACVALAFLVPLAYPFMSRAVNEPFNWRPPFKGYLLGLRHWSLLFVTLMVTAFVTVVLTLVCELPAFVIAIANAKAYAGAAMGDPLNLPENMALMSTLAFIVAGFVQAYVHLYTVFPLYYAYGSIEQWKAEINKNHFDANQ